MHTLPLGSPPMPKGKWGRGKGVGGRGEGGEGDPPPSPNNDNKDDKKARANPSGTHQGVALPTHHGRVRPAPMKHPNNDWEYHIPNNQENIMIKTPSMSTQYDISQAKPQPSITCATGQVIECKANCRAPKMHTKHVHLDAVQFQHINSEMVPNQHQVDIKAIPALGESKPLRCQNGEAGNLKPGSPKKPMINQH